MELEGSCDLSGPLGLKEVTLGEHEPPGLCPMQVRDFSLQHLRADQSGIVVLAQAQGNFQIPLQNRAPTSPAEAPSHLRDPGVILLIMNFTEV